MDRAVEAFLAGIRRSLARLRREAAELAELGRRVNPDLALAELARRLSAPGATLDAMRRVIAAKLLTWLLAEQDGYDRALRRRLVLAGERVRREGGSADDYRAEALRVGALFGAAGLLLAPVARTWYDGLLRQPVNRGRTETLRTPTGRRLVPYGEFHSMDDEHVRANHWALHSLDGESAERGGFVAPLSWPGWRQRYEPPLGYGCRCNVLEVGAADALKLGWSGEFPRGTGYLETRRVVDPATGKRVWVTPGPDATYHRLIIEAAA